MEVSILQYQLAFLVIFNLQGTLFSDQIGDDSMKYYFLETFDSENEFENRWVHSTFSDIEGSNLTYEGKWKLVERGKSNNITNKGLKMDSVKQHYAISAPLEEDIKFDKPFLIVQYQVKFPPKRGCGGGYIKLLSDHESNKDLHQFNKNSRFTLMFGPDRCFNDHNFHFILRYEDAKGKWEEKHLNNIPINQYSRIFTDDSFHLFKLNLSDSNSFQIFLDNILISSGSLFDSFTPSINPPEYIDDPEDVKPIDWDERKMIPDPSISKPSDWDEKYPKYIPDPKAKKPDDWNEDIEPYLSVQLTKPEDWNEEVDGEWLDKQVKNPDCIDGKCGKWNPPMISNCKFKQWEPKLIKNPNYKGVYESRTIKNPTYYFNENPYKMTPISAIGIELWSVDGGVIFDNILITYDTKSSIMFDSKTFKRSILQLAVTQLVIVFKSRYFVPISLTLPFGGVVLYVIYQLMKTSSNATSETDIDVPTDEGNTQIAESDEDPMSDVKKRLPNIHDKEKS